MVRKLALAVSLALGTVSVPVHALGLGELDSKSTLNQNFRGDIRLLSVPPEELDGIRVKLADAEAFERAGVDRPFYLSLLKFQPEVTNNGKTVVRVTSDFPIREPFLNFLVEVNWPNGRLLREYTVLLDPPTTTMRRAPQVAPALTSAPAVAATELAGTTAVAPKPTPATAAAAGPAGATEYGPVKANDTAWRIAKQVRPGGVSMEQMMMALLQANPQAFVDGNINRLRRGQILRVPAVDEIQQLSRAQARQAYRDQQDAWLAQRNERLQAAATASTGDDSAAAVTPTGAAAAGEADQLRIATARPDGEGEAGAGDDAADSTAASDLKSRLLAARETAETSRQEAETLRTRVDELQERLSKMQKLLSLKDQQLAQLQDRVATEGTVESVDAALDDLVLANQVGDAAPETAAVEAPVESVITPETMVPATAAPAADYRIGDIAPRVDPDRIVEGTAGEEPPASTIADIAPQVDPDRIVMMADQLAAESGAVEADVVAAAEGPDAAEIVIDDAADVAAPVPVEPSAVIAETGPEPAPVVEPDAEADTAEGFVPAALVRLVEQNMLPIGAGAVGLLALIGFFVARGRRKQPASAEPALVAAAPVAASAGAVADEPVQDTVDQPAFDAAAIDDLPDSTLLDDFAPSDINALQDETGEVDPVSEADVYIAYGRYQQAEELLRQALGREPDRLALKHKLLEVHYATKNGEAFAALAEEMVQAGQDAADEQAWARAQDMGRELMPENAVFAGKEGAVAATATGAVAAAMAVAAGEADNDDDSLALDDLEISELNAAYDAEQTPADELEAPSEVSISLDLEDTSPLTELVEEPTDTVSEEVPDPIELDDLDSIEFDMPEAEAEVANSVAAEVDSLMTESLDLDSMMAEAEAAVDSDESELSLDSEFSADDLQAQLDELSDLSVLDSELNDAPETTGQEASRPVLGLVEEDTVAGGDGLDQPIDLDEVLAEDYRETQSAEVIAFEEAVSGGGGEDDVATKLDLARAYVDMGDEEGARSILEEVVAEGSDAQRGDAETILAKLG